VLVRSMKKAAQRTALLFLGQAGFPGFRRIEEIA
jgi:hypothetical protein